MAKRSNIPPNLIFICEPDKFVMVDESFYDAYLRGEKAAWTVLPVGKGEIFETRPIKVRQRTRHTVEVVTAEYVVRINIQTGTIFNVMSDGSENEFRGGIVQSDARQGWIPVRRIEPRKIE